MITGGLDFVWAAYAVAVGALASLAVVIILRLRHWAARAREIDKK